MIELCDVTKRYGGVHALRGVSLRAGESGVVGLLGQNGAGKTTLINILTGYIAPTSGRALVDGLDPLLDPVGARRALGYLPEQPPLYDEMTVREYLRFAAELRGVRPRAIPAHADEVMELCGLAEMRDRLLGHLSKGYRQRAGLAQALCGDPRTLVLDEPTVGLDPRQITEIRELIRTLGKGRTVLFSSHMLGEVQQLCDHVVIIDKGRVRLDAPMAGLGGGAQAAFSCAFAAGADRVLPKLRALAGVRDVSVKPSAPGETWVTVAFDEGARPERELFALAVRLDAPILRLTREADSLESVFLRAISREEEAEG